MNDTLELLNAQARAEYEQWLDSLRSAEDDSEARRGALGPHKRLWKVEDTTRGEKPAGCVASLVWARGACVNEATGPDGCCDECRAELADCEVL